MNKYEKRVAELGGVFSGKGWTQPVTLSEEQLQKLEKEIGFPLPEDYREFLKDYGGYGFWDTVFSFANMPDRRTWWGVGTFYGVIASSPFDLLMRHHSFVDNELMGPELLPIMDEGGDHDPICLFLGGDKKGTVHLFYEEEFDFPYDYSNLYHIADSFDEFIQMLRPINDEEKRQG